MPARYENAELIPYAEGFLTGDSPETRTSIISDNDQMSRYTKFRIEITGYITDNVTVSLLGNNLGCGHNLYVTQGDGQDDDNNEAEDC